MAAFNEVQKRRRKLVSQKKRNIHGDPVTKKLKRATQPQSVSGKRQRKLLKKWRREQKERVEKGLISLDDVEMTPAGEQGEFHETLTQTQQNTSLSLSRMSKFHLKKRVKYKSKSKHKRIKEGDCCEAEAAAAPSMASSSVDAMVE